MSEKCQVLENPNLESSAAIIRDSIAKHKSLILVGSCRVEYRGRARSILELGERIVIIKEDGATLIHRPKGYKPVNWQPSGCYFQTDLVKDVLVLNAARRSPPESLRIFFDQVYAIVSVKIVDFGKFDIHVSEKEIQDAIYLKPEILEDGFTPIGYEKKIEPGFLDLYGIDSDNRLVVVEIKRIKAGKGAVLQLAKYVDEIRKVSNREVRGVLAAPKISKGTQKLLATLKLEFKKVDLEKCVHVLERKETKQILEFLYKE